MDGGDDFGGGEAAHWVDGPAPLRARPAFLPAGHAVGSPILADADFHCACLAKATKAIIRVLFVAEQA